MHALKALSTLLLALPLITAKPAHVIPFNVHPGLLPRQQDLCRENGRAVCDNSCMAIGSNCCGKGDGTYCLAGTYCTTGGCCTNGRTCTGQAGTRTNSILTGTYTVVPTSRVTNVIPTSSRLILPSSIVNDVSSRLTIPDLPSLSLPSIPSFPTSFPTLSLPSISLPSINVPSISVPSISSPSINPGGAATGLKSSVVLVMGGVAAALVGGAAVLL